MNATPNWNNHAAEYHFKLCTTLTENLSFGEAYMGTTFQTDFDSILAVLAGELQTKTPRYKLDDILGISLTNWPDR